MKNNRNGGSIRSFVKEAAILALVLIALLSLAACQNDGNQEKEESSMPVELIGHRGYSDAYPENTMPAFEGAVEAGFGGIEIDIWESDNGDLMIAHDSTTDRMCGKSANIWEVNSENRDEYPIQYGDGETLIPTFEEVLDLAKSSGCTVLLHIKTAKNYKLSEEGVNKIVDLIKKY